MNLKAKLFILIFFATLYISFSGCFKSILIRYNGLEEFYKRKHARALWLPFSVEGNPTNHEIRSRKSKLCSMIADSIFFKYRNEGYLDTSIDFVKQRIKKYYTKFNKINFKQIKYEEKFLWFTKQKIQLVDIYPYRILTINVGEETMKEKVFPCLIRNIRSNVIQQIFVSLHYKGKFFVFKRDRNMNLRLLTLVEKPVREDKSDNTEIQQSLVEIIRLNPNDNSRDDRKMERYYGTEWVHTLSDERKLRLCNMAINVVPSENVGQKMIFWPQKFNLDAGWIVTDIRLRNSSVEPSATFTAHYLNTIGCRSLNVAKNQKTMVYISNTRQWNQFFQSVYVYVEKQEEDDVDKTKVKFLIKIIGLELTTEGSNVYDSQEL